jgi:hypothetical protein
MVLHVTACKLICTDIEVAIVYEIFHIIFHSHIISVYISNEGTIMLNWYFHNNIINNKLSLWIVIMYTLKCNMFYQA